MTRQQILETSPMQTQNAVMKYLLMIFALIFVGCSEYPITKINCSISAVTDIYIDRSYVFVDSDLFNDAEVEIFNTYPATFKCGAYSQNNSSIKCMFKSGDKDRAIFYNKLDKTIREEVTYVARDSEGNATKEYANSTFRGSCRNA